MEWKVEDVRKKLEEDPKWQLRGVLALYKYQTQDEQECEETKIKNGVGFNGVDANFLTSIAKQLQKGNKLSEKQLKVVAKLMPKYAKQLTNIANSVI